MKNVFLILFFSLATVLVTAFTYPATKLLDPTKLAEILKDPASKKPVILNVGPSPDLPGAINIGNVADPENKERLNTALKDIPKNSEVVIYCGCCKLEDCWNIYEADKMLTSQSYTNFKILNLPTDFNTDWAGKKYPVK